MRLVIQRVQRGSVSLARRSPPAPGAGGEPIAAINRGLVVLAGVRAGDTAEQADWLAEKTANLRIFEDEAGKLNRSVLEVGGSVLVVSQFTLYANTEKGRRPSFVEAAPPEQAEPLVARYAERLRAQGLAVQTGRFRAEMLVEILNDGPVTIILER